MDIGKWWIYVLVTDTYTDTSPQLWMSFLDPFHCLFSALFSVFSVFALIIFTPIRLFQRQCSSSTWLIRIVAPVWRNHLKMIYADSLDNVHTFEFSPFCLILIQV